jgi:hypothetical protein
MHGKSCWYQGRGLGATEESRRTALDPPCELGLLYRWSSALGDSEVDGVSLVLLTVSRPRLAARRTLVPRVLSTRALYRLQ